MRETVAPESESGSGVQALSAVGAETTALHLAGLPSRRWLPLAQALQDAVLRAGAEMPEGVGWQASIAGSERSPLPDAHWILFVEHPAQALVSHWQAAGSSPPEPVLRTWLEAARHLLRQAHAAPRRCLLVETDEAWSNPEGLEAAVAAWSGLTLRPAWPEQRPAPDAALIWMARQYCAADRQVSNVYDELLASCAPLPGPAPIEPAGATAPSAMMRYLGLLDVEASQTALVEERARLLVNLHETQLAAEEQHDRVQALLAERSLLTESEARNDLLLAQLHVVQADLEAALQRQQDLATAVHAQQQRADEVQAQLDAEIRRRPAVTAAPDELQQALKDRELLAEQLYRALAGGPAAADHGPADIDLPPLSSAGSVVVDHVSDKPPHRELRLTADAVALGERVHDHLRLKLVEHEGRPGIVLLATPGLPLPLSQWQPAGREAGTEFMLLIPADPQGRSALSRLGSADWQTVLALSDWLRGAVAEQATALAPHWSSVAGRLFTQVRAVPPRLRYDVLQTALDAREPAILEISLRGVMFGLDKLADITLRWRIDGQGPAIAWVLPRQEPNQPPLANWPIQDDGSLQPTCPWALGPGFGWVQRMRWWHALPAHEHALLMGLIDTLRAAAEAHAGDAARPWLNSARLLHRQARQARRWGGRAAAIRARLR